ncbi:MAG TPA: hypothetical protein VGS27_32645 [Candidatus Sulfotelmatobacter sp.]|nr:hypothetical protein [Candidatus Sulfotelmatobacter sp.]
MELLLNLAWLLLALPAFLLWRDSRSAHTRRKFTAFQCLLALGCMLVMLFPVVSATDDLRAMRAEMEESPTSKRSIAHSSSEKAFASNSQVQSAVAISSYSFGLVEHGWHFAVTIPLSTPASPAVARASRAPPQILLG